MTALNIKTCTVHGAYSGGFDTCPVCSQTPLASKTKPSCVQEGKATKQVGKPVKPLNALTAQKRLQVAGLTDVSMIVSGLQTGAVASALYGTDSGDSEGVFLAYVAIVDSLVVKYPQVARYRNRLVSGKLAA